MLGRNLFLAAVLLLAFVAVGPVPTASATHSCGIDVPCAHPEEVVCLLKDAPVVGGIVEKFFPCS